MNGSGANVAGCATCKGRCCREYRVAVTVADVQQLAAGTAMPPSAFITLRANDEGDGFRLRPDGPAMELNLIRRQPTGGCVFLLEISPTIARCGVYAHRPQVCRNFPAFLKNGAVGLRDDVTCGSGSWNLATMDLPTYRRDLTRGRADWVEHWQIVRAWNAAIEEHSQEVSPEDLYDFLLTCRIAKGNAGQGGRSAGAPQVPCPPPG